MEIGTTNITENGSSAIPLQREHGRIQLAGDKGLAWVIGDKLPIKLDRH